MHRVVAAHASFFFFFFLPSCLSPPGRKRKGRQVGVVVCRRILWTVSPPRPETSTSGSISPPLSPFPILHSPCPFPQFPGTVRTQDRDTGSVSEDSQSQYLASCDASSDAKPATITHQLNLGYTVYPRRCRDGPALSASGLATGIVWFCPWQIYFWRLCRRRGQLEAGHG